MNYPRIVSLIPSATEIVAALGLQEFLVGRSHECDYPAGVENLLVCTRPKFDPHGSSLEIHQRVTDLLQSALSVYEVNVDRLMDLQPTHILTQAQCEVCAVSLADVEQAVATWVTSHPQIISLQPLTLKDLWDDIARVAQSLHVAADSLIDSLQGRVNRYASRLPPLDPRPTVACLEWTEPLMAEGNWVPELVALAGGKDLLGIPGHHSTWLEWETLRVADPDLIIFMPCGYDLQQTRLAAIELSQHPEWEKLRAARSGHVYLTDGNQYFNRPGPRLVDSLEILAEILHPQLTFDYEGTGWELLPLSSTNWRKC